MPFKWLTSILGALFFFQIAAHAADPQYCIEVSGDVSGPPYIYSSSPMDYSCPEALDPEGSPYCYGSLEALTEATGCSPYCVEENRHYTLLPSGAWKMKCDQVEND